MSTSREDILKTLEPLFARARAERLWFYCSYQALNFSPSELTELQSKGRFCWGSVNWELIDPRELLKDVAKVTRDAENYNISILARIGD